MESQIETGRYGFTRIVELSFEQAVDRTRAVLKEQGFGVLSEIDIQKAMKEKLGKDIPRHLILGACNPPLAYQALEADPNISLLLPCNVTVRDRDGQIEVAAIDAGKMLSIVGDDRLEPLAAQVNDRLRKALEAL